MTDKRRDRRLDERLDCDVHLRGALVPARITNVSRSGLFIVMAEPPPVGHVVTLTVHLPGGTFELMATVQRHAGTSPTDRGAGLLIFALGGAARARWETFVRAGEAPGFAMAPAPAPADVDAAFLIQLDSPRAMFSFFDSTIAPLQTVYVTPPFRRIGARVAVSLVHPTSEVHETFHATVAEFSSDRPERMGLKFDPVTRERRAAFLAALGPIATEPGRTLLEVEPGSMARVTEYAFVSPKLRGDGGAVHEPLTVVQGTPLPPSPPPPRSASQPPMTASSPPTQTPAPPAPTPPAPAFLGLPEEEPPQPEFEHVDRRALFDFNWNAHEPTDPTRRR